MRDPVILRERASDGFRAYIVDGCDVVTLRAPTREEVEAALSALMRLDFRIPGLHMRDA